MAQALSADRRMTRSTTSDQLLALKGALSGLDRYVVGLVLAIKAVLLVFGVASLQVIEDKPLSGPHPWLAVWNRWDGPIYLHLAEAGYTADYVFKAYFYPLFPWSVRGVALLTGNYLIAGFVVSGCASLAAALLLGRIAQLEFNKAVARRTVWFFLIFPSAYILHVPYTEALFLALALGSILAARHDKWWAAGPLGALACMTRANGIVLIPALTVEAIHRFVTARRWNWRWLWIATVPLGFGVYLLLNWHVSGNEFSFLGLRKSIFSVSSGSPWLAILQAWGQLQHGSPNHSWIMGYGELFFFALTLLATIVSWIKLRPVYATWMTVNWLLINWVTFFAGGSRYALTAFPMFMLLGLLTRSRLRYGVITFASLLLFSLLATLFVRGWWVS